MILPTIGAAAARTQQRNTNDEKYTEKPNKPQNNILTKKISMNLKSWYKISKVTMSDSPRSDTSVCDACSEFHHLLRNRKYKDEKYIWFDDVIWQKKFFSVEDHLHSVTEGYDGHEVLIIDKHKLDVFYQYLGIWVQR